MDLFVIPDKFIFDQYCNLHMHFTIMQKKFLNGFDAVMSICSSDANKEMLKIIWIIDSSEKFEMLCVKKNLLHISILFWYR